MTKQEFAAWQAEVNRSKASWVKDLVLSHNSNGCFLYRGGESGTYISVSRTGLVEVGTYTDAFPHIGEAFFKLTGTHQCKDYSDAMTRICNAVGLQGTVEALL